MQQRHRGHLWKQPVVRNRGDAERPRRQDGAAGIGLVEQDHGALLAASHRLEQLVERACVIAYPHRAQADVDRSGAALQEVNQVIWRTPAGRPS